MIGTMDGLDEFEKNLAAEKAERERALQEKDAKRERRHRHHSHHHEHRRRERSPDSPKARHHKHKRDEEETRRQHRHKSHAESSVEHSRRHKRPKHSDDDFEETGYSRKDGRQHNIEGGSVERQNDYGGKDIKDLKQSDPKEDLPLPDEELAPGDERPMARQLERDAWMKAPSAIDVDYIQRSKMNKPRSTAQKEPTRVLHHRELNTTLGADNAANPDAVIAPTEREISYTFGDEGSQWRMTKLKAVYTTAEQTGRPVDEIAVERFGSLQEFDDAREEQIELDRRRLYGEGYIGKEKPTGDLFNERKESRKSQDHEQGNASLEDELDQGLVVEEMIQPATIDQSTLNRLRAQMMKAKLRNAPDATKLEAEYNAAMGAFKDPSSAPIVLDATYNRMLAGTRGEVKTIENKRGRERGLVTANEDMSIDDMVREERRTRGLPGGEGRRLAERIAKDGQFDNDLDYMDENAEKLAQRVHKSEISLKNMAVTEFQKLNRILDTCPLCHHEDRAPPKNEPIAPVIALATRVFLTLPPEPELTGAEGGAVIVPINHRTNLLECDDDEWEEIRNFMKSLTRMYHDQGREVLFYENAAAPHRRLHAALVAVPIPYDLGDTAPAFFKEAILSSDEEWSQHKKIIDTGKLAREGLGKLAFRRSIAKEMPYFHVWFTLDGGLGHIVEDSERWPKGDLFAREVIGGMVDSEPDVIKRQGRWTRSDERVEGFRKRWRKFDWTRILTEG
ncbi:hypothetical protein VTK73DRAFT_6846 [Phialemonium thermophilum]|uniref:Pre-mRNA-splicing factor cwf19 n=1 Tax=Phialemonium thermophilum TaxID=223376 RepID=A0ABR3XVC3_9PEZI